MVCLLICWCRVDVFFLQRELPCGDHTLTCHHKRSFALSVDFSTVCTKSCSKSSARLCLRPLTLLGLSHSFLTYSFPFPLSFYIAIPHSSLSLFWFLIHFFYHRWHPPSAGVVAAALVGEEGLAIHQCIWEDFVQGLRQYHTHNAASDGHQTQDYEGDREPHLRLPRGGGDKRVKGSGVVCADGKGVGGWDERNIGMRWREWLMKWMVVWK